MQTCPKCGLGIGCLHGPAPANDNGPRIVAANDNDLREPEDVQHLARVTVVLGVSRRRFLDFLAETIFGFDGDIVWPDGKPFCVNDTLIDDAFPDGSARWVSDFWRFAERRPRQRAQSRVCGRLRVIRIAVEINEQDIVRGLR